VSTRDNEFPGGTLTFKQDDDDEKWARRLERRGATAKYKGALVQDDIVNLPGGGHCIKSFRYDLDEEFSTANEALEALKKLREDLGLV
jgi:hypothetical protein